MKEKILFKEFETGKTSKKDPEKPEIGYEICNGLFRGYKLVPTTLDTLSPENKLEIVIKTDKDIRFAPKKLSKVFMLCTDIDKGIYKGEGIKESNIPFGANGGWANWILFDKPISYYKRMSRITFDEDVISKLISEFCSKYIGYIWNMAETPDKALDIVSYAQNCCVLPPQVTHFFIKKLLNTLKWYYENFGKQDEKFNEMFENLRIYLRKLESESYATKVQQKQ